MLDFVLVGGGLANGLLAARLAATRPALSFVLVEAGDTLGGNHTWSFHGTDVSPAQRAWLAPLVARSWPAHDVAFHGGARRLGGEYHSITSERFHAQLLAQLGDRVRLGVKAREVGPTHVVLEGGERLEARAVIDGRGFSGAPDWPCGFQKFLGLDVELEAPHGLEVPLLMDGRVAQHGAFRFLYLLPWDERRVLVEDTAYADGPELDLPLLRARIHEYLATRGMKVKTVLREEAAALPIPLSGEAPRLTRPTIGVAAGLFHATTGYSVPMAAELADALVAREDLSADALTAWLQAHARRHWSGQGFFRLLNRMLFRGAEPEARVKIFDSFYRHREATIARFYAGRLNALDMAAILARGSRTVPGLRAMSAAFS
ncbi:MAG: lycopene beta-cyclase CrtY [Myxococcota bacterium]